MKQYRAIRAIISGGGTGGHIFPAVSIANKLKELNPETEILFVGANGRMEMDKVPSAGYRIVGLTISGLQRSLKPKALINNITLPFKTLYSRSKARKIIREFKPDIAIGVGGYASAPLLFAAAQLHIPCLIQEQNSFAGLTNRMLASKAERICVAYEGMERFFPAEKIIITGNPIRSSIKPFERSESNVRHILIIGGSLGARTLNTSVRNWIDAGCPGGEGVEILWQCGKYYKAETDEYMRKAAEAGLSVGNIRHTDFIRDMDREYGIADIVISRAGASSVSELCAAHKASIFVPSPNVAEDHQRHNAMALVEKDAAIMVSDDEAPQTLMRTALELVGNKERIAQLEKNIAKLALTQAALTIADEIYKIVEK